MKDGEKTYSTSQIAGIVGLHPNTVRKYEEWGLLQTPERKPNGYRVYTDVHIKQFELAKIALQSVIVQAGRCTTFKNYKTRSETLFSRKGGTENDKTVFIYGTSPFNVPQHEFRNCM